jgi:hypothetical protein
MLSGRILDPWDPVRGRMPHVPHALGRTHWSGVAILARGTGERRLSGEMRLCIWHPPPSSLEGDFGVAGVAGGVTRGVVDGHIGDVHFENRGEGIEFVNSARVKVKAVNMLYLNQKCESYLHRLRPILTYYLLISKWHMPNRI